MPGTATTPTTDEDETDGMMTEDMVAAIVCYEATLNTEDSSTPIPPLTSATTRSKWPGRTEAKANAEAEAEAESDSAASEEEG